jgi:alpha-2-macroglobulin
MTVIMKKILLSFLLISLIGLFFVFTSCSKEVDLGDASDPALNSNSSSRSPGDDKKEGLISQLDNLPVKYYTEGPVTVTEETVFESDDPFILTDFGPRGELPSELKYPSVWVLFSQPVIPLAMVGSSPDASQILEIEPALEGDFRWYGTKLLSFEASEKGLPQHIYNISVNDKLLSLGGKALSGRNAFSFHTEYLSMVSIVPGRGASFKDNQVPISEAGRISITFNHPVNLEVISKYLRVSSGGKNYDFRTERPENPNGIKTEEELSKYAVLELNGILKEDSKVFVRMLKGARSEFHFIGTPEDEEKSFKTFGPFSFVKSSARSYSFPGSSTGDSNPVYFELSHPIDYKNIDKMISLFPDLLIVEDNITVWNNIIKISNLPVEYDKSYIFTLSPLISDIYGRKLNKTKTITVDIPEASSYSWFPNSGSRMLESSFDPKIIYEFQNIFDGDWKVDSIEDPYKSFNSHELVPYDFSGIERNIRHFEVEDLSPWLSSEGTGWVGFSWNFQEPDENGIRPDWGKQNLQLQVTDLALTTRYGYNKVLALVSSLSTGELIEGAKVSLMRDRDLVKQSRTDASGLAVFYLEEGEYSDYFSDDNNRWKDHLRLRVETDSDSIEFKPNSSHNIWHMGIYNVETPIGIQQDSMETLMFTDRGLYRPGETVTFRGIDRNLRLGEYSSFVGPYTIHLREPSYQGKILAEAKGFSSDSGGFYGSFDLPSTLSTGYYRLVYNREGGRREISFQVANFENLAFSIDLSKPDIIQYPDRELIFNLSSTYLAGGSLSNASYNYAWSKVPVFFKPPGSVWDEWTFGPGKWDQSYLLSTGEGVLDPEGKAVVTQKPTSSGIKGMAYNYTVEMRVMDQSNQEIASRLSVTVHPGSFYLAMKLQNSGWSGFVEKGETVNVDYSTVDPVGNTVSSDNDIKMELIYKSWKMLNQQGIAGRINTSYEEVEELETSRIIKADSSPGSFEITTVKSGSYLVRLSAKDSKGRDIITNLPFYSTGGDWIRWGRDDNQDINLEADKTIYKPGETAKLIIKSPLPSGQYLITTEREGIFDDKVIYLEGGAQVIGIPIEENYVPVVYVAVSSWSKRTKVPDHSYFEPDLDKPKGYFGITALNIDNQSRTFDISVETDKPSYKPGDEVEMKIKTSFDGRSLGHTEITLMAVDRGVLDLINYHVPNPVDFFYSKDKFPLGTRGADTRSLLIDPVTYEVKDLQGGDASEGKLDQRDDFNPTAVFEPYIITNSKGEASIKFTLPDNLTTYRMTAIGVKDNKFGIEEGEIFARNPVNVRSIVPSTLRYRDTTISGVSLTNLSVQSEEVSITVSSDILTVSGDKNIKISLEPGQTEVVNFSLSASVTGKGTVNFAIRSNILNEDLHSEIIVEKPYITETFAISGRIADSVSDRVSVKESLIIPSISEDGIGSLSFTLAPGFGGELKSAAEYLQDYPYNCFEQRSSKIIPRILFQDENSKDYINTEISLFAKYQNSDGGIPFWPDSTYRSSYYISLRVAYLLHLLKEADLEPEISPDIDRLLGYINNPDKWVMNSNYLMAFRYFVSALYNRNISGASALLIKGDELGLTAYAMLGLAFTESGDNNRADAALSRIRKFIQPGTRTIDLTETAENTSFYASKTETLSLLLMLLQKRDPESELLMRTANTLSLKKRNGYWGNTADTSWAMLALSSGINNENIDISGTVDISDINLAAFSFADKNAPAEEVLYNFTETPLDKLERDTMLPLTIVKLGSGSLFYTGALKYALPSELIGPGDQGIGLYTTVTDLDGNIINSKNLIAGNTYLQKIVVSSHRDREYLSLRVPVPTGARILDASFITTSDYSDNELSSENYWYNAPRKEILENEVQYFFDSFEKGKKEVEFYFRAVRPGVYPTPPIQAECMYQPEIFGRTSGGLVIIDG